MKISNGIDIVNINRKEFKNPKLVNKILHPNEMVIFNSLDEYNKKKFIAKIWCIKEAVFKSYNHQYSMNKIQILYNNNKPYVVIDTIQFDISVSYENDLVIAIASTILL